ncbi:MAG TPA: hypothetical protein VNE60_02545 [Gemmatimonadaceae bacterium]|nr:hypothetical protein [Gemmatimonadaceae bacterium]
MGCLARLGCLVLLVLLGFVAWLTRDRWLSHFHAAPPAAAAHIDWQPLTLMGARRAQAALDTLSELKGPVFQNVAAGDASAYVLRALLGALPEEADSAEAAVVGDQLLVRASVKLREVGASAVLGPLASLLGDRERMQLAGSFHVIRPGLTEFRVRTLTLRNLTVPEAVIPKLIARLSKGVRSDSLSANGLPIATPRYLVDIRITNGHLTLYKGLP